MLSVEAQKMGFRVIILDPSATCPASSVCHDQIVGGLSDLNSLLKLADLVDVITFEIEHIDCDSLLQLQQQTGKTIYPNPNTLSLIKDKFSQKTFLKQHNLPTGDFREIKNKEDLKTAIEDFGLPLMVKARFGGYDGKGNFVINQTNDIDQAFEELDSENLYAEKWIPFQKELSVIVVKSQDGDIKTYPVVDTYQQNSICSTTVAPAQISLELQDKARKIAFDVLDKIEAVGVFAIEMFLTKDNQILINEIAPRVHNSGHWTMEGCVTSQFNNHIRAVTGLPLGSTQMLVPVVGMVNILGANYNFLSDDLPKVLAMEKVFVHNYGKIEARPNRKMGHINILANSYSELDQKIQDLK
jgi:5-(carboxyamino)imidazole ribonucleotide synthase